MMVGNNKSIIVVWTNSGIDHYLLEAYIHLNKYMIREAIHKIDNFYI